MKVKSLQDKLELYYDRLKNPKRIIGNWAIIDTETHDKLKKITLTNISSINKNNFEYIISAETKDKYISIKYTLNFIAVKIIDREYDYILKDWDLIGVDVKYLHTGNIEKQIIIQEIIKLLGFKLTKKARLDLENFS